MQRLQRTRVGLAAPSPEPLPNPPPSPPPFEAAWRAGQAALWVSLGGGLALSLAVAGAAPEQAWLVPAGVLIVGVAGAVAVVLPRRPIASFVVVLGGFTFAVNSDTGLQPGELVYGLYLYTYLAVWYGSRLARGERIVRTPADWALALLLVGGGVLGSVTAVVFGASFGTFRGDLTAFLVLGLYFPVKDACFRFHRGPEITFGVLLGIGAFLGIQNFLGFREIIATATVAWQVADARFAATETISMVSVLGTLTILLFAERWWHRVGLLGLLLFLIGSLILTKGRTFWIAALLGAGLLLLLLRGRYRLRLVSLVGVGATALVVLVMLFFGRLAELILSGAASRFAMIGGATTDVSLLSRIVEWKAVWEYIQVNPLLGYGFGTNYKYFDMLAEATLVKWFIHNGYLAAWFKLGVFGLAALVAFWLLALHEAYSASRSLGGRHRAFALTALIGLVALALAANMAIFFLVMDQVFVFTALSGLAGGLHQRYVAGDGAAGGAGAAPLSPVRDS